MNQNYTVVTSGKSWMESRALMQLEATAKLEGMVRSVGMPDLHPSNVTPVGAAFLSEGLVYPHLIGNDIGCGMRFSQVISSLRGFQADRWVKKIEGSLTPEGRLSGEMEEVSESPQWISSDFDSSLGTVGRGNHFAELQAVQEVNDPELFESAALSREGLFLLVHSGSRGLGNSILTRHRELFGHHPLRAGSDEFREYLKAHDFALRWASENRNRIAVRLLESVGARGSERVLLDSVHNFLEREETTGLWIHRKGAASASTPLAILPGSRGSLTYLVAPLRSEADHGFSLAHGAGRKWDRKKSVQMAKIKYKRKELFRTSGGGRVVCDDPAILYEEIPEAYKKIEEVVADLESFGLIRVVASFRPLITYKEAK